MADYISRKAAIAYIREQSEECQKAFEELGGESGIYADAYNDLAEDFYGIPAADVAPVVHGQWLTWEEMFPGKTPKKKNNLGVFCSSCKNHADNMFDYCPNCGARMDGDAE